MNKTNIIKRLRQTSGSDFMSLNKIAKSLGVGIDTVKRLLEGVDYLPTGENDARHYLIDDVAAAIAERRRT